MNKDELILIEGSELTDLAEMTIRLLEEADLASMIPSSETRIAIKPNLVSAVPASEGATTHPEIVDGLIRYLHCHDFRNITVMEGSWVGEKTQDAFIACGFASVLEKNEVPFLDMQKEPGVELDCKGLVLNVCRAALESDFLINVPVLKGHCQTKITCALKNMKGILPNSEKRRFHRMGLHDPIGHLSAGIHQDFILVDSICGDLTLEDGGNPIFQGRLIAAADPVLCDAFGCHVIGLDPLDVGYIQTAKRLGVGNDDIHEAKITLITRTEKECVSDAVYPAEQGGPADTGVSVWEKTAVAADMIRSEQGGYRQVMKLADNVCEVESCSACYGYLIPALQMLKQDGLLDRLDEQICIGQGYRGRKGMLGVGNCTKEFTHTLPGCPPTENQMYEFLKEYITAKANRKENL